MEAPASWHLGARTKMRRVPLRDTLDTDSSRPVPVGMARLGRRDMTAAPPAARAVHPIRPVIRCRQATGSLARAVRLGDTVRRIRPVIRCPEGKAATGSTVPREHPVGMVSMVLPEVMVRREVPGSTVLRAATAKAGRMIHPRTRLQGVRRVDTERPVGRPATIPWAREAPEPARHRRWSRPILCIPWCSWC